MNKQVLKSNQKVLKETIKQLEALKEGIELPKVDKHGFLIVDTVRATKDYDKLEFFKANREVRRHFKGIIKSMEKYGNFSVGLVAFVNGKYFILDGQHRFESCKFLNIPFEFKIIELTDESEMLHIITALNSNAKNWSSENYLEGWANLNVTSYVKLLELTKNSPIGLSILFTLFNIKGIDFKSGLWECKNFEKYQKQAEQIAEILPIIYEGKPMKSQCIRSLISLVKQKNYNHKKMLKVITNGAGSWSLDEKELKAELFEALKY